jgi:3-methyladenine DNA glycosylase Tag
MEWDKRTLRDGKSLLSITFFAITARSEEVTFKMNTLLVFPFKNAKIVLACNKKRTFHQQGKYVKHLLYPTEMSLKMTKALKKRDVKFFPEFLILINMAG